MSRNNLDLGGITDANGNLGRPVPSGHVLVPGKIELVGDSIQWELAGHSHPIEILPATLGEFATLWSGESSGILEFARRWGVLVMRRIAGRESVSYLPCGESMPKGSDPIAAWRYYSRRAFAVLNIAAALRQEKLGDLGDWGVIAAMNSEGDFSSDAIEQDIYGMGYCLFPKSEDKRIAVEERRRITVEAGRRIIGQEIANWLTFWRSQRMRGLSDFSVQWNSKSKRWELQVDYHGFFFAAIGLQLALCVAGADTLYTCSGCGCPYVREIKRPKPGTANYCPKCRSKGVAQRRAVDTYSAKKLEAIRRKSTGVVPSEIASVEYAVAPNQEIVGAEKKGDRGARRKRP
jgi:hypothetical protein